MSGASLVPADGSAPASNFVCPLLTDMYQVTMAYAYWKAGRHEDAAVFDAFFRKNPFGGEFTIFAGLEEAVKFVQTFRFAPAHVDFLRGVMPDAEPAFFDYLAGLDCSAVKIYAVAEGTVVFPRVPLLRVEGPLAVAQLLETTLLNLLNYASLVCTNAARFRLAAGRGKALIEMGLRRAQGPDGAMSASRYAYAGGFDGTSNLLAALHHGVPPMGTHAHALVSAFVSVDDLPSRLLGGVDIVAAALRVRAELGYAIASNGELAAFIAYAQAFPRAFTALVDTYDTLSSGVPNFLAVAVALTQCGYAPGGIRLDSGDLAYLSKEARRMMAAADARYGTALAATCRIVASNEITEDVLVSLNDQGHEVDAFGIGTHLVTCLAQPALGMVYKLVEINAVPRIKLSNDVSKVTIPGAKEAFRLIGSEGVPLLDLLIRVGEARPQPGKRLLCRHPFDEKRRVYVTPTAVIPLLRLVWKGARAPLDERLATEGGELRSGEAVEGGGGGAGGLGAPSALAGGSAGGGGVSHSMALAASAHVPPASAGLVPVARDEDGGAQQAAAAVLLPLPESAAAGSAGGGGDAGDAATSPQRGRALSLGSGGAGGSLLPGLTPVMSPSSFPPGVSMRARFPTMPELRAFVGSQLNLVREDHLRSVNPTPYKVSVSTELFHFIHELWMREIPIPELG